MTTKNNGGFLSPAGPDSSLPGPATFVTRIMPRAEVEHLLANDRLLTALTTSEKTLMAMAEDLGVEVVDDLTPADADWAGF